ncbi:MAG: DUF4129 domain-containing protein [Caldilineaceae bacterium]
MDALELGGAAQPTVNEAHAANEPDESKVQFDQPWLTSVLRPMLIAVMAGCMVVALIAFLRHAFLEVPVAYTSVMLFLGITSALIACISTTWLAQPEQRMRRNSGLRTAEFALILAITRLTTWITVGYLPSLEAFLTRPLETLIDPVYILSCAIVLLAWFFAASTTSDFLRMGLQSDELYAARQRTGRSTDDPVPPNYINRRAVLGGFVARWLGGGILLVLLAAGTRVGQSSNSFFAITQQNISPAVISAIIIYYLTGLVLISQGQLAVLRARWTLERVPSRASVLRNWPVYALGLIFGMGFLAGMMPFGGTFYLATVISTVLRAIYITMLTIMQIFMGLLMWLGSLLAGDEPIAQPETPPPAAPPRIDLPPADPTQVPEWLGGVLFWGVLALILGYALYIYFSGRGINFAWLRRFWALLRARWAEMFGTYQEWQAARVRARANRQTDGETGAGLLSNLLRWRNLNPDQQVRYFYLTTLQRAEKAGIPRRSAETPLQYAPRLLEQLRQHVAAREEGEPEEREKGRKGGGEMLPSLPAAVDVSDEQLAAQLESAQAVQELTEAFVRVRYAGRATQPDAVPYLKQLWDKIKRQLRRWR